MSRLFYAVAATLAALLFFYSAPLSSALSYTLVVQTAAPSYYGSQPIVVFGKVNPAPGPNTAVFLSIVNPSGKVVFVSEDAVNGTTGVFSDSVVPGTSSDWLDGTYTVNASWGAYGPPLRAVTTFTWSSTQTVTTSTTTAQVPEFTPGAAPLVLLLSLLAVAALVRKFNILGVR
jgi:hypothetical protein